MYWATGSRLNPELCHACSAIRFHGLIGFAWRTLLVFFLKDLRKVMACRNWLIFYTRWVLWLFYTEQIFTKVLDGVLASGETLNFWDVSELAPTTAILPILDMLVWVDNLYHFLLLIIFKVIFAWWGMESGLLDWILITKWERFTKIVIVLPVNAKQVKNINRFFT